MDLLITASGVAGDFLERTSSTQRVQQMVQLSLAPAFLLGALGAFLSVMNQRIMWVIDRIHLLEKLDEAAVDSREIEELPALRKRQRYAHLSINLSAAAGLLICIVVSTTFLSAFVRPPLGSMVALIWILVMSLFFCSLLLFLLEVQIATKSSRDTRKLSRKLIRQAKTK